MSEIATAPQPPLQQFRIIGVLEKTAVTNVGTPFAKEVPGGSCWHCGTSIRICVQAKNAETGETVDIGTTCAERIGLDRGELKRYLAERFAEQRWLRSKAYAEAKRAEFERREADQTAKYGPHGSPSRFGHCAVYGDPWNCDECRAVAPHGTWERFWDGPCSCDDCVRALTKRNQEYEVRSLPVLVALVSGRVVDEARMSNGQYGASWLVPGAVRGAGATFVPMHRKRRATVVARGYTYAQADYLVRKPEHWGDPVQRVRRLTQPVEDDWGEPIPAQP
jgi:hypothetical protein